MGESLPATETANIGQDYYHQASELYRDGFRPLGNLLASIEAGSHYGSVEDSERLALFNRVLGEAIISAKITDTNITWFKEIRDAITYRAIAELKNPNSDQAKRQITEEEFNFLHRYKDKVKIVFDELVRAKFAPEEIS